MTAPIIVYRPKLLAQKLTALGADDGAPVDVTCDMESVEIGVDAGTTDVTNFCGTFSIPDDLTVTATLNVMVNDDTDTNWLGLVGKRVRFEVWDRTDATRYRTFESQVMLNPSLYGNTTPGEARMVSFDVAVLSDVEWVAVV